MKSEETFNITSVSLEIIRTNGSRASGIPSEEANLLLVAVYISIYMEQPQPTPRRPHSGTSFGGGEAGGNCPLLN